MPLELEKQWAAVQGDRIIARGDTEHEARQNAIEDGYDSGEFEIIAYPKHNRNLYV